MCSIPLDCSQPAVVQDSGLAGCLGARAPVVHIRELAEWRSSRERRPRAAEPAQLVSDRILWCHRVPAAVGKVRHLLCANAGRTRLCYVPVSWFSPASPEASSRQLMCCLVGRQVFGWAMSRRSSTCRPDCRRSIRTMHESAQRGSRLPCS